MLSAGWSRVLNEKTHAKLLETERNIFSLFLSSVALCILCTQVALWGEPIDRDKNYIYDPLRETVSYIPPPLCSLVRRSFSSVTPKQIQDETTLFLP